MGFKDLFGNFFSSPEAKKEETAPFDRSVGKNYLHVIDAAVQQMAGSTYYYHVKATDLPVLEKVKNLHDREKVAFILEQIGNSFIWKAECAQKYQETLSRKSYVADLLIEQLLRQKISFEPTEVEQIADRFILHERHQYNHFLGWPIKLFVNLIQKQFKQEPLPNPVESALKKMRRVLYEGENPYYKKQSVKIIEQVDSILFSGNNAPEAVKPVFFLGQDDFAAYANNSIRDLPDSIKPHWYKLMAICQKASGSKPSKRFVDEGQQLINQIGPDLFKATMLDWFAFIVKLKEQQIPHAYLLSYIFITDVNAECVKGLIWQCVNIADPEVLQAIADVAGRAYRKIPGIGQTATMIGNASIYTLYRSEGIAGIGHLSHLKLLAKQLSTQAMIEKYIRAAAEEQSIAVADFEDLAISDFGLADSSFQQEFEGYRAIINVGKNVKVSTHWYKPDGTVQKSEPGVVKEHHPAALKKLKDTAKQIEAALATQRDRLDRSFREDRQISWAHFNNYQLNHGLLSIIARQMIWRFEKEGQTIDALYLDGQWLNCLGDTVCPEPDSRVSLWHPATDSLQNVRQWRNLLISKQVQQPVKQAFREIYLLTDAEVNTRTYSNRMAGHILKQHQFNSLAKARGWRYNLQGNFDGGDQGTAQIILAEYHLVASYWTNAVGSQEDTNDTGIFSYVATDQVRFTHSDTGHIVELAQVPVLAFSEVMRDVDLFVGVASVGNDPNWRDNGGLPAYRDYWHEYAFGELSELSKNRKEILERLVPRLKIAKVAVVKDKFLVVTGKKRTYKIHLGSTNILMEPNDQYLCIVPDRSSKSMTENVFLPFEGDTGLSVIISKAMLLANDDQITDVTITRQINRQA